MGCGIWLRDVTQAYTQSSTSLQRLILAYLPKEMRHLYSADAIMVIMKPLYGIPVAGTHWFRTYYSHHTGKLQITTSTYDPCLLITTTDKEAFGIVGMQTDDTLILGTEQFSMAEDIELEKANFRAKPKSRLTADLPIIFNGDVATLNGSEILLKQKNQADKLQQID